MKLKCVILLYLLSIGFVSYGETKSSNSSVTTPTGIRISNLKEVARLTGKKLPNEQFPSPNNTDTDFDVCGTDLGIMWQMKGKRIGLFFGDTNGAGFVAGKGGGNGTNWRSNVLAFSEDTDLTDGITISGMLLDDEGKAKEVCAGGKTNPQKYQSSIPSGAIRAGNMDCVHYMNIHNWGGANGRWHTNFSSIYTSTDDGKNWTRQHAVTFDSTSHFSQVAYAKKGGIVYMIGTQSGRGDNAYLARFAEKDLLDMARYEYWNGNTKQWVKGDEKAATPIIQGPIGEASLMYHKKYKRWIFTFNCDYAFDPQARRKQHAILYCDTDDITQWGEKKTLLTDEQYKGLYCAYMHPWNDNEDKLYFLMSLWAPYNVYLMSVDLDLYPTAKK